jgi:hypothetical protein
MPPAPSAATCFSDSSTFHGRRLALSALRGCGWRRGQLDALRALCRDAFSETAPTVSPRISAVASVTLIGPSDGPSKSATGRPAPPLISLSASEPGPDGTATVAFATGGPDGRSHLGLLSLRGVADATGTTEARLVPAFCGAAFEGLQQVGQPAAQPQRNARDNGSRVWAPHLYEGHHVMCCCSVMHLRGWGHFGHCMTNGSAALCWWTHDISLVLRPHAGVPAVDHIRIAGA